MITFADPLLPPDGVEPTFTQAFTYYSLVLGLVGIITIIEIGFLYWDSLHSAVVMKVDNSSLKPKSNASEVNLSMIRAALEIPNSNKTFYSINPMKNRSKYFVLYKTISYKAKITITNLLIKILCKRAIGRSVSRYYIEFVSIPVFAIWNYIITIWIMQEIKIRSMGPFLVDVFYQRLFPNGAREIPDEAKIACFITIRSQVLQEGEFHPNILLFLRKFAEDSQVERLQIPNDNIKASLRHLPKAVHPFILETLTILCALHGQVAKYERAIFADLHRQCGTEVSFQKLDRYLRFVLHGEPLPNLDIPQLAHLQTE